jgi:hypothetical protein
MGIEGSTATKSKVSVQYFYFPKVLYSSNDRPTVLNANKQSTNLIGLTLHIIRGS